MTYQPTRLSQSAFDEFKVIYEAEFKESVPDSDLEAMGVRLLELFSLLLKEQPARTFPKLTEDEERAYQFIQEEIKQGRRPTARSVANVLGLKSSKSGHKIMQSLKRKGVDPSSQFAG